MCVTILWVGEQDDSTTLQSINSLHWRPSFQRRRIEIRGRIVKSMLSNCSEMFILGTYWTTWYSLVSEQTCTIDHKMDQSLWQTIISFDLLHSSHMWLQGDRRLVSAPNAEGQSFCSFSCSSPLWVIWLFVKYQVDMGPKAGREHGGRGFWAGQTELSAARTVGLLEPWLRTPFTVELWVIVAFSHLLNHDLWRFLFGLLRAGMSELVRVSPADVDILSYHSDVSVESEKWRGQHRGIWNDRACNGCDNWPMQRTSHPIHQRQKKVVTEMNRDSTPSNIAEVLRSSAPFHVRPPSVFRDFRAEPWINVSGKRPLLFSSRGTTWASERIPEGAQQRLHHDRTSRKIFCNWFSEKTMRHLDRSIVPRILCLLACWPIRTLRCAPRARWGLRTLPATWYIKVLSVKWQKLLLYIEVIVCTHIAGSGKANMDLGTAMEIIVVIMSTYRSSWSSYRSCCAFTSGGRPGRCSWKSGNSHRRMGNILVRQERWTVFQLAHLLVSHMWIR